MFSRSGVFVLWIIVILLICLSHLFGDVTCARDGGGSAPQSTSFVHVFLLGCACVSIIMSLLKSVRICLAIFRGARCG
jgi:hypothetical protein